MGFSIPQTAVLELSFSVCAPIGDDIPLPFFHGGQWNAYFRNALRSVVPKTANGQADFISPQIRIVPVETGVRSYHTGDIITIGLSCLHSYADAVAAALRLQDKKESFPVSARFSPHKTVRYEGAVCRICGKNWRKGHSCFISSELLSPAAEKLSVLPSWEMVFRTPLTLKRPVLCRVQDGIRSSYCDQSFFFDEQYAPYVGAHLLESISGISYLDVCFRPTASGLIWLENRYGASYAKGTALKGICGSVRFSSIQQKEHALILLYGQYVGFPHYSAWNSFGAGEFVIPEAESFLPIRPLRRHTQSTSFLDVQQLRQFVEFVPETQTVFRGIRKYDMQRAGDEWFSSVLTDITKGKCFTGGQKHIYIEKTDHSCREITLFSPKDHYVQKVFERVLSRCVGSGSSTILSLSSYAQAERGYHEACGVFETILSASKKPAVYKGDIASFFDTIDTDILFMMLKGMLYGDDLYRGLCEWQQNCNARAHKGIPQGSPLSPLLAELYLTSFDSRMLNILKKDTHNTVSYIRYVDDFIIISRNSAVQSLSDIHNRIENSLVPLKLSLKQEKSVYSLNGNKPVTFLGKNYFCVPENLPAAKNESEIPEYALWQGFFSQRFVDGKTLYIHGIGVSLHADDQHIFIKQNGVPLRTISWNAVSDLFIVGKIPFTSQFHYMAIKHGCSITYTDFFGRTTGSLGNFLCSLDPYLSTRQFEVCGDEQFVLQTVKELIKAKLHNTLENINFFASRFSDRIWEQDICCVYRQIARLAEKVRAAGAIQQIMGYEGTAAQRYFSLFPQLLKPFPFNGRNYHPALDPANALLSLGYIMLYGRITAVLRKYGFRSELGFLHARHGSHQALASDLQEQFRFHVDRLVVRLIAERLIVQEDFEPAKGHPEQMRLRGNAYRCFLQEFENSMRMVYSFNGNKQNSVYESIEESVKLLAAALRLPGQFRGMYLDAGTPARALENI